ncbi:hypothetical protein J5N97_022275 [Dioscorea zingiberensis]|uniref:DUF6821 domain-containing protein n=1 Tax=Dioscorea zingiberensis TaxID=325984 RepID=A0A9D5CAW0_9LILI|nr:hypothetical protein J5N97_022275 [Dioscorea zingiberensis]
MADSTEFLDWELLRPSSPTANPFDLAGAINPEYFSLSSAPLQADRTTTVPVSEEPDRSGRIDSDYADHPESERGFEFSFENLDYFSSEGSSFLTEGAKGETLDAFDRELELGFEGASTGVIFQEEEAKAIKEIEDPSDFSSVGSSSLLDIEIRALDRELGLAFEGIGKSCEGEDGIEGCEVKSEESRVEGETKEMSGGNGEKKSEGWWKLPIEVLKFYVLKTRPIWSVTIAAAIVGVVLLGRRLYRMKQRSKSVSLKASLEDKKTSLLMALAANLNEAFSVMKRAPIIRPTAPAGGLTPWPLLGLAFE